MYVGSRRARVFVSWLLGGVSGSFSSVAWCRCSRGGLAICSQGSSREGIARASRRPQSSVLKATMTLSCVLLCMTFS
eukprot:31089_1